MKRSTKAALFSGLVFPGLGHLYLRKYWRGVFLVAIASVALYTVVSEAIDTASSIVREIELGGVPLETEAISNLIAERSRSHEGSTDFAAIVFLVTWVVGIIDSCRVGRRQELLMLAIFVLWTAVSPRPDAQEDTSAHAHLQLVIRGEGRPLPDWEQAYVRHAMDRLFAGCATRTAYDAGKPEDDRANRISVTTGPQSRRILQATGGSSQPFATLAFLQIEGDHVYRYDDCQPAHLLPLVGIMEAGGMQMKGGELRRSAGLTSYEPNRIGWTFDDNDVDEGFLDATVSLKYPFLHDGYYSNERFDGGLYFAFTGRFGQYIESRDSSPVVGKRFNPKLFWRYWLGDDSRYIDFGLAHESNGQNIHSGESYRRAREELILRGQNPDFARDYISRGWDYLSLDWRHTLHDWNGTLNTYLNLKYFLDDGPFQGEPEEYNDWEGDGVRRRKEYDGVSLLAKYEFGGGFCLGGGAAADDTGWSLDVCLQKAAWQYTTGYDDLFDNNTNRLEFTVDLWSFPVMFWGQTGYNSDLVDYYRRVDSWGISLELQSNPTRIW